MLQRMAQHYTQLSTSKEHKYKILSEASHRGHDIRFAVLYYASSVDSLEAELGEKEGELIRKYLPPLNTQIPKEENWRQYKVNTKARTIPLSEIIKD